MKLQLWKAAVLLAVAHGFVLLTLALANEESTQATQPRGEAQAPNADWILELAEDTNSAARLSAQEEEAHAIRVKRLHELASQAPTVIEEPAGAPVRAIPLNPDAIERLIEAVEQLQMEIRELNLRLGVPQRNGPTPDPESPDEFFVPEDQLRVDPETQ